jgi:hypothetical protein
MTWERHGDILILVDREGWKRAMVFMQGSVYYFCLAVLGIDSQVSETRWDTKQEAKKEAVRQIQAWSRR